MRIVTKIRTPMGTKEVKAFNINTARLKKVIMNAFASIIIEAHELALKMTEERFKAFIAIQQAGGQPFLTTDLYNSYKKSLEGSSIVETSKGYKAGFFSYSILNEHLPGKEKEVPFSWWKVHEFGSFNGGAPLKSDNRVLSGEGTFIPKEGKGFYGEGFFMSKSKFPNVPPTHPGVVPIRNIVTIAPFVKSLVRDRMRGTIPNIIGKMLIGE